MRGADKHLIVDASLFDVYAGQGVPEGQVSLAVEAVIQPREKTLTDKEIEQISTTVVAAAEKAGAQLRR